MADNSSKKDQARILYSQGETITAIANRLKMSRKQIGRWKAEAEGTSDDWDALKANLVSTQPSPTPKIISFERPRHHQPKGTRPPLPPRAPENMDLVEVVDGAIATIAAAMSTAQGVGVLGSAASGLVSLIKLRREMGDDEKLANEVLKRYQTPAELREFFVQLKEAGWGGKKA